MDGVLEREKTQIDRRREEKKSMRRDWANGVARV